MVYFIQAGKDGPVKIGYSKSPTDRLQDLQVSNATELHIVRILDGNFDTEKALQKKFSSHWIRGEWYECKPVLDYLSSITLSDWERFREEEIVKEEQEKQVAILVAQERNLKELWPATELDKHFPKVPDPAIKWTRAGFLRIGDPDMCEELGTLFRQPAFILPQRQLIMPIPPPLKLEYRKREPTNIWPFWYWNGFMVVMLECSYQTPAPPDALVREPIERWVSNKLENLHEFYTGSQVQKIVENASRWRDLHITCSVDTLTAIQPPSDSRFPYTLDVRENLLTRNLLEVKNPPPIAWRKDRYFEWDLKPPLSELTKNWTLSAG